MPHGSPSGDMVNMTMESASLLTKAGIAISIETGYEAMYLKQNFII